MTERLDITVGGIRLACHVSGSVDDPPMVLLHALGERGSSWDLVAAGFEQRFRVLSIDLRGHGDSDRPSDYSFELMRDDILDVLDQLSLNKITLMGHSMGGTVAYLVAEEQPGRVERLILEDTPPPFPREPSLPTRPEGPLSFDWAVVPALVSQLNDPDPTWWERLADITAPTLIVAGGPTSHIPQDKLRDVADQLRTCALVTIPVGHHIHEAEPAKFIAAVRSFLNS